MRSPVTAIKGKSIAGKNRDSRQQINPKRDSVLLPCITSVCSVVSARVIRVEHYVDIVNGNLLIYI